MNNEELEYPLVICYILHIEIHPLSIYFRYVRFSEGIFEENIRHKQHVLCFIFFSLHPGVDWKVKPYICFFWRGGWGKVMSTIPNWIQLEGTTSHIRFITLRFYVINLSVFFWVAKTSYIYHILKGSHSRPCVAGPKLQVWTAGIVLKSGHCEAPTTSVTVILLSSKGTAAMRLLTPRISNMLHIFHHVSG